MSPVVNTGIPINVAGINWRLTGLAVFGTKRAAMAALTVLRADGLNVDPCIEAHQAHTPITRTWVLGRPDPLAEYTWLMRPDGTWARGQLTYQWQALPRWWYQPTPEPIPATFQHITRTVPDSHDRHERYRTKSNGSCGRWVTSDDSVALCTCGWKTWHPTRDAARDSARAHRDNPGGI